MNTTMSAGITIPYLSLLNRSKTSAQKIKKNQKNKCADFHTKLHAEAPVLNIWKIPLH